MAACVKNMLKEKLLSLSRNALHETRRHILVSRNAGSLYHKASLSSSSEGSRGTDESNKNPLPIFLNDQVQTILSRITGLDIYKINRVRKTAAAPPEYHLLTDEQLKEKQNEALLQGKERLQMPPYMKLREPIEDVLSEDSEISGLYTSKFVFVDITYGLSDRKREIVVRDEDGTLRKATWEERDKINQIYNPKPGRQLFMPKMFLPENLERLLANEQYEYILDCACVQFEPDSEDYIRVSQRTYEAVENKRTYEDLRSTRHFGPLAFYLAWHKQIDHLLIDMLKRDKISDAVDLVMLYHILNPNSQSAIEAKTLKRDPEQDLQLLEVFTQTDAKEKGQIELALQSYTNALNSDSV